jgi:aspartate/methionine/tyrosine aminotransferase
MPLPTTPAPALRLARRTARIEPFRVMELVKRARDLERSGRSIIHLSIGEPDFTAAPSVVQA